MNQRKSLRQPLQIDLSKHLFTADEKPVRCLGVDASSEGIGIVGFQEIPQGSQLVLVINNKLISLEVIWCRPDTVRKGIYHVGLERTDDSVDIVAELETARLIKKVQPFQFPSVGKK
ncbi:MAG: hypothetical protein AB7T49_10330 [Oligoflexales bacterium]